MCLAPWAPAEATVPFSTARWPTSTQRLPRPLSPPHRFSGGFRVASCWQSTFLWAVSVDILQWILRLGTWDKPPVDSFLTHSTARISNKSHWGHTSVGFYVQQWATVMSSPTRSRPQPRGGCGGEVGWGAPPWPLHCSAGSSGCSPALCSYVVGVLFASYSPTSLHSNSTDNTL